MAVVNKAYVDPQKCDSSPMCPARRSCPENAITQEKLGLFKLGLFKRGVAVVDSEKCVACGVCISKCPHGAIEIKKPAFGQKKPKKKKKR